VIGWTLLSRQAVARAAEAMADGEKGVRDEVGFLGLHQAISDRLFPGTSVLHTRARYVLLVPWTMQRVARPGESDDLDRRLLRAEASLAGQCVLGSERGLDVEGAIGTEVWRQNRRPAAQPPSFSYWSALGAWGILTPTADRRTPGRRQVLRRLARRRRGIAATDDDPLPDVSLGSPFIDLPAPPKELGDSNQPMSLALLEEERRFLRRQFVGVRREDGKLSLLAALADARIGSEANSPWEDGVARFADEADRDVLRLARGAAAISAIGRAVYARLVEKAWNDDRSQSSTFHADRLAKAREIYGQDAARLEVDDLFSRFLRLSDELRAVLKETQHWLTGTSTDPDSLLASYAIAEKSRKRDRARLGDQWSAKIRRKEWELERHPAPVPIAFRWSNVRRLLRDISGRHGGQ
jgi:hypothetical protein